MFANLLIGVGILAGGLLLLLTLLWGYVYWGPAGIVGVLLTGPLAMFAMILGAAFNGAFGPLLLLVCAFGSWAWAGHLEGNR